MKHTDSISMLHLMFLAVTVISLKQQVTILGPLLTAAGRDSWLSVLSAILVLFPWIFVLLYINKKTNQEPLKDWLGQRTGKIGSAVLRLILVSFLLLNASFTIIEMLQWMSATFLPETPAVLMLILFTVLCVSLSTASIQIIVMMNIVILSAILFFGFFVAFTNLQVKSYELLQPFVEHGFEPVVKGMIYPASGISEVMLFLFLQHKVKERIRFKHLFVLFFTLTVLTLGTAIGSVAEFGPVEAANQRFPAYEQWGLISIGRFIEHLDFLSIYSWLAGAFIRVGVMLYIIADLFNVSENKKKIWSYIAPPFFFGSVSLLLISGSEFHEVKDTYVLPVTLIICLALSFFVAMIALFSRQSSKRLRQEI